MPLPHLNLLLTFDYELPLGSVRHSYDEALFEPTEQLLALAQQLEVPLIFFVDILSYYQLLEWGENHFCKSFHHQIQSMLQQGHEVQLHIHPHWWCSKFENGIFIPSDKYALGDFEDREIEQIILLSVRQLNELCQTVIPNYRCSAFRAGGFCLTSKADVILKELYKNGIRYDSSICKGYFYASSISKTDNRITPQRANWFLPFSGNLAIEGEEGIFEIPVAGKPKSLCEIPTSFKLKKYADRAVHRGTALNSHSSHSFTDKLNNMLSARVLTVDNYTYSLKYLMRILSYNLKKYASEKEIALALIAHPKSMGEYAFNLLHRFVIAVREQYGNTVYFNNFNGIN